MDLHDRIAPLMELLDRPRKVAEIWAHAWLDVLGAQ